MPAFVRYEAVLQNKSARTNSWAAYDESHASESARQYRQYQGRTAEMQLLLHRHHENKEQMHVTEVSRG
jgi:hypothetical protein